MITLLAINSNTAFFHPGMLSDREVSAGQYGPVSIQKLSKGGARHWPRTGDTNPLILAVAFAKPGGGYALAMQNHTLIDRHIDPSLSDVLENGAVSIVRGNLRVAVGYFANAGSWWMGNTSYTFRYRHGGFNLIGYDKFSLHRSSHEVDAISINYLTGKIKITTNEGGRENEGKDKVQWKKLSSLKLIPIAAVDGKTFTPGY